MKKIKLTKDQVAIVDDEDFERVSKHKWQALVKTRGVYATMNKYTSIRNGSKIRMHRFILGVEDTNTIVDHINGNGLDNRKENLRICSPSENQQNRSIGKNNSSGYKGVNKKGKKFEARLSRDKSRVYLGLFDTAEEAARAYDDAAAKFFGSNYRDSKGKPHERKT